MATIVNIKGDHESDADFLQSYVQSGSINFLLGSGASSPAIPIAGNIEETLNKLLLEGEEERANIVCLDFIENIAAIHPQISTADFATPIGEVTQHYREFLSIVDRILFSRKNILLPRQATVFTTNYDMFLEHASSLVPSLILNDGFERTSSLNAEFNFTPERYFDRTYRSGPIYGHQIEIPTINLVKLHGSLSWRRKDESIVFDPNAVPHLKPAQRSDQGEVSRFLEKHFLILPNFRKFHDYN